MKILKNVFFLTFIVSGFIFARTGENSKRVEVKNIKVKKFIYLDDDFYKFNNSQIPQFFSMAASTEG